MILWMFALFDFFIAIVLLATHFDFFPWRIPLVSAMAIIAKAIVFNDKFLSFMDILAGIYLLVLILTGHWILTLFFILYFLYKILVSV